MRVADELIRIAVAGDDDDVGSLDGRARRERRDHVVGLDAGDLELLDLQGFEDLVDQRQLRAEQIGSLLAARLVLRIELDSIRAAARRVEGHRDEVGVFVGHDLGEHRGEAVHRVRPGAGLGREVGRQREERPVRQRMAVQQQQFGHRGHATTTRRHSRWCRYGVSVPPTTSCATSWILRREFIALFWRNRHESASERPCSSISRPLARSMRPRLNIS